MRKILVVIIVFATFRINCFADNNALLFQIVGLYFVNGDKTTGLYIYKVKNGDYIFQKVLISQEKISYKFEWQSAYVHPSESNEYEFYWHTGRFDDNPETNKIIVYRLKANINGFEGIYFFPEEPKTPPAKVRFVKLRGN